MTLAELAPTVTGVVESVCGSAPLQRRLAELGFRPGVSVEVMQRCSGGGRVIAVGNARIALDRASMALISVRPIEGEPSA